MIPLATFSLNSLFRFVRRWLRLHSACRLKQILKVRLLTSSFIWLNFSEHHIWISSRFDTAIWLLHWAILLSRFDSYIQSCCISWIRLHAIRCTAPTQHWTCIFMDCVEALILISEQLFLLYAVDLVVLCCLLNLQNFRWIIFID